MYFALYSQVHLIHIFCLPHRAQALQFSVALCCYIVQIHWRLTYKTPGLEESIIAPLTLLLHPPLLAFLPSLINRPALGALLCSQAHFHFVCVCVWMCLLALCLCVFAYVYMHGSFRAYVFVQFCENVPFSGLFCKNLCH